MTENIVYRDFFETSDEHDYQENRVLKVVPVVQNGVQVGDFVYTKPHGTIPKEEQTYFVDKEACVRIFRPIGS
jgi:hypothetical protein